jgi:hypothetical protein
MITKVWPTSSIILYALSHSLEILNTGGKVWPQSAELISTEVKRYNVRNILILADFVSWPEKFLETG